MDVRTFYLVKIIELPFFKNRTQQEFSWKVWNRYDNSNMPKLAIIAIRSVRVDVLAVIIDTLRF